MAWSAGQYLKFEDERTRPARDLLAQVPLETAQRVVDLGCGPGNSTELLVARFGTAGVAGLDSDENMLAAARKRLPDTPFEKADLESWLPPEPVDLLYANAVFQWVPDHVSVLARLMDGLKPGGVLAVQMPDNLGEPLHVCMEETGAAGPWAPAFANGRMRRTPLSRQLNAGRGSMPIFFSPRWFFSAMATVSGFSTRPCSPMPSFSHMRMKRM